MATKVVFNQGKKWLAENDVGSADLRLMLIDDAASWTPDVNVDKFVDDIAGDELATANYTRKTLTSVQVSVNTADNRVEITADDVTWTALGTISGPTIGAVVLYAKETDDTDSPLISALYGVGETLSGGDTFFVFDPSGFLRIA